MLKVLPISLCLIIAACDNGVVISPKADASTSRSDYIGESYTVTGSVANAGGGDVAVTLSGASGIGNAQLDADGGYTFSGVRPGNYVLTPSRDGYYFVPTTQSIAVNDGNVIVPAYEMRQAPKVSGTIRGSIARDVKLTLSQEGGRERTITSNAEGNFEFTNVQPGKYTLKPQFTGYVFRPSEATFEVTTGDLPGYVFEAILSNRSIYGKIFGAARVGVTITAEGPGGKYSTVSNADGEYTLEGVKVGTYTVTPVLGNFTFSPESYAVQLGWDSEIQANFISSRMAIQCNSGWCTPWDVVNYELVNVRGSNGSEIWTSGARSALLHYATSGTGGSPAWFPTPLNTGDIVLAGIWASGAKSAWLVGSQGTILRNNGNGWIKFQSPTEKDLLSIWGNNENSLWAVGADGIMLRYDNGTWENTSSTATNQQLNGIWGAKNGVLWAVGANGTILTNLGTGTGWVSENSPTTNNLNAIWGRDDKSIWAVGDKGTILRRFENVWKVVESGTTVDLFGVWAGAGETDVWAVGPRSTVLRYTTTAGSATPAWQAQRPTMDLGDLRGVWSAGDGYIWMAGNRGVFSYQPTP